MPSERFYPILNGKLLERYTLGKVVSPQEAEKILSNLLIGCSINLVTYYVTDWIFRVIGNEGHEREIRASEIVVPNIEEWNNSFKNLPTDLLNTHEPDDVIAAAIVFSVLNKWPIAKVSITKESDLVLTFENKTTFTVKAHVEYIDWTWQVDEANGENIVFCDSGELTYNIIDEAPN